MSELTDDGRRAERLRLNTERAALLKQVLRSGDRLMVTRCMGHLYEYMFTNAWDGLWLIGYSTWETDLAFRREDAFKGRNHRPEKVNDIAPMSITHINRVPVEDYLAEAQQDIPF